MTGINSKPFNTIVQAGSFTKAALQLNIEQSTLSRSIQVLEASLGYTVFIRRKSGVTLTGEGSVLFQATQNILSILTLAESQIDSQHVSPCGILRVSPTVGIFPLYIAPHIPGFLESYPDIRLVFFATDTPPQLENLETDVIIYPFIEDQPHLIQRPLLSLHTYLYASAGYLEQFGTPTSLNDLDNHHLIASSWSRHIYHFANSSWILTVGKEPGQTRASYIEENSSTGRMILAQSGLGITALPKEHPGLEESGLVPILPDLQGPTLDFYYTYSEALKNSKRVSSLWEYLSNIFQKERP